MKDDKRLSYSSWSQLETCEMAYAHRKVFKTKVDNEEEDRTAFDVGSATHQCMEDTQWGILPVTVDVVTKACKQYPDSIPHKGLVHAMALNLVEQQQMSFLKCVKAEFHIESEDYIGFIDLVAKRRTGHWYMVDLKTASAKPNDGIIAGLPMDRQLNLYSGYYKEVASVLGLDPKLYMGIIYRVAVKSKAQQKIKESYEAYVKRLTKVIKVYDVVVPLESLSLEETRKNFLESYKRSLEIREGMAPSRNLGACFNYFRFCPYYSQCHGKTGEELKGIVKIKLILNIKKRWNLYWEDYESYRCNV